MPQITGDKKKLDTHWMQLQNPGATTIIHSYTCTALRLTLALTLQCDSLLHLPYSATHSCNYPTVRLTLALTLQCDSLLHLPYSATHYCNYPTVRLTLALTLQCHSLLHLPYSAKQSLEEFLSDVKFTRLIRSLELRGLKSYPKN